jgi:hypothetical protein
MTIQSIEAIFAGESYFLAIPRIDKCANCFYGIRDDSGILRCHKNSPRPVATPTSFNIVDGISYWRPVKDWEWCVLYSATDPNLYGTSHPAPPISKCGNCFYARFDTQHNLRCYQTPPETLYVGPEGLTEAAYDVDTEWPIVPVEEWCGYYSLLDPRVYLNPIIKPSDLTINTSGVGPSGGNDGDYWLKAPSASVSAGNLVVIYQKISGTWTQVIQLQF